VPTPSDREVLTGVVERITYQNTQNGFCVMRVKARGHRELVTLVGHAATMSAGEWVTASGSWVNDRTHGQQFKFAISCWACLGDSPRYHDEVRVFSGLSADVVIGYNE
jgi:hypothetical protein